MHEYLEGYFIDKMPVFYSPEACKAKKMADCIIKNGLKDRLSIIYGAEVRLYYQDMYAGTSDGIGVFDGEMSIIDFKQTNQPKKEEWIEDYFLQLAAYATAHNWLQKTNIRSGVILMCSQFCEYQEFKLTPDKFEYYQKKWFKRVEKLQEISTS